MVALWTHQHDALVAELPRLGGRLQNRQPVPFQRRLVPMPQLVVHQQAAQHPDALRAADLGHRNGRRFGHRVVDCQEAWVCGEIRLQHQVRCVAAQASGKQNSVRKSQYGTNGRSEGYNRVHAVSKSRLTDELQGISSSYCCPSSFTLTPRTTQHAAAGRAPPQRSGSALHRRRHAWARDRSAARTLRCTCA